LAGFAPIFMAAISVVSVAALRDPRVLPAQSRKLIFRVVYPKCCRRAPCGVEAKTPAMQTILAI
jgi:hypothetical protein